MCSIVRHLHAAIGEKKNIFQHPRTLSRDLRLINKSSGERKELKSTTQTIITRYFVLRLPVNNWWTLLPWPASMQRLYLYATGCLPTSTFSRLLVHFTDVSGHHFDWICLLNALVAAVNSVSSTLMLLSSTLHWRWAHRSEGRPSLWEIAYLEALSFRGLHLCWWEAMVEWKGILWCAYHHHWLRICT